MKNALLTHVGDRRPSTVPGSSGSSAGIDRGDRRLAANMGSLWFWKQATVCSYTGAMTENEQTEVLNRLTSTVETAISQAANRSDHIRLVQIRSDIELLTHSLDRRPSTV